MNSFISIEAEKLLAVASDISFLNDLWQQARIEVDDVRRSWPVIRRLLLDRELQNAASKVQHTIFYSAPSHLPSRTEIIKAGVTYLQNSIARVGPVVIGGFSNGLEGHLSKLSSDTPLSLSSKHFLNQKVIYFHGDFVTRGEIIRYAANRMGGVHFGQRASEKFDLIDRIRGSVFLEVDGSHVTIKIQGSRILGRDLAPIAAQNHFNPVHLEMLATARLVATSPSIIKLCSELAKLRNN